MPRTLIVTHVGGGSERDMRTIEIPDGPDGVVQAARQFYKCLTDDQREKLHGVVGKSVVGQISDILGDMGAGAPSIEDRAVEALGDQISRLLTTRT